MLSWIRASFAAKLLLGGMVLALAIIGGVSAYLLVSREQQTTTAALSNADNRAAVLAQLLVRVTGEQSASAARELAAQPAMQAALASNDPAAAVQRLVSSSPPLVPPGESLLITDRGGLAAYAEGAASATSGVPQSVVAALQQRGSCYPELAAGAGAACGLEVVGGVPGFDVAVPVVTGEGVVGAIAYLAPLQAQLASYQSLIQYPVAVILSDRPGEVVRLTATGTRSTDAPAAIAGDVARGAGPPAHLVYSAGGAEVAGSFDPVLGPDGRVAAWVGVEAPLAAFAGPTRTDELTVALIALLALIVTAVAVMLFVERFVRRPLLRLDRGVTRIAAGDYGSPVEVSSHDELGRLAASVNRMGQSIDSYVSEIRDARARLDQAVTRVSDVSRALTGTTQGVAGLDRQVARAAASLGGDGASAWLAVREGRSLSLSAVAATPGGEAPRPPSREMVARLLDGKPVVESLADPERTLLAVPMFFQGAVVGALAVVADAKSGLEGERDVLGVLASNAAIARENARLFELERATVARLRELDTMKNEFLATVQHELRTPLTAILGLADLSEMCWQTWEDRAKAEAVHDIRVAARNLYDMVETILDFSLLGSESVGLHPALLPVRPAVERAMATVGERYRSGITNPVEVDLSPQLTIYADPERLDQVLRAVIDNAVKFSDGQGAIEIIGRGTAGHRVLLVIEDHGAGIPEAALPLVFDHFFQADGSATRKHGGSGMGLALVRRLAAAHGATVEVRSDPGKGTAVILDWPDGPEAAGGEAAVLARKEAAEEEPATIDSDDATDTGGSPPTDDEPGEEAARTLEGRGARRHRTTAPDPASEKPLPVGPPR